MEKHPERVFVDAVKFIGEQNGPPEKDLKEALKIFFHKDGSIITAYLARVKYDDSEACATIALCLRTQFGPDHGLAEKAGRIFARMFGRNNSLDIIFLSHEQEIKLAKVCSRFFG